MFILIPLPKGLNRQLIKSLQKGELTVKEVYAVQKQVDANHQTLTTGYKRACIIMAIIFLVIAALSVPQINNFSFLFQSLVFTGGIAALILVLVKFLYIDFMKKQFYTAVRKGYPMLFLE